MHEVAIQYIILTRSVQNSDNVVNGRILCRQLASISFLATLFIRLISALHKNTTGIFVQRRYHRLGIGVCA